MWRHPTAVCMTYLRHLRFSLHLSWRLGLMSLASLVHAFVPDVLVVYTSNEMRALGRLMQSVGCR